MSYHGEESRRFQSSSEIPQPESSAMGQLREASRQLQDLTRVCDVCDMTFPRPTEYNKHMKMRHLPPSVECEVNRKKPGSCTEKFRDKKEMKRHLEVDHRPSLSKLGIEYKTYKCGKCKYESNRKDNVLRHYREAHENEKRKEKKDKDKDKGEGKDKGKGKSRK